MDYRFGLSRCRSWRASADVGMAALVIAGHHPCAERSMSRRLFADACGDSDGNRRFPSYRDAAVTGVRIASHGLARVSRRDARAVVRVRPGLVPVYSRTSGLACRRVCQWCPLCPALASSAAPNRVVDEHRPEPGDRSSLSRGALSSPGRPGQPYARALQWISGGGLSMAVSAPPVWECLFLSTARRREPVASAESLLLRAKG